MQLPLVDALRFARGWRSPPADLEVRELRIPGVGGADSTPATLSGPPGDAPHPGWVVLHGITRRGREHPSLRRFTGALAATGARVLVPEIAEWTRLELVPLRAQAILRAAIRKLADRPDVRGGGVVVAGFSFGGPQALHAGGSDEVGDRVRGVLAWGSYADLRSVLHFQFTGEYGPSLAAQPSTPSQTTPRYHAMPDPYGRWVVGSNCLPLLEGRGPLDAVAGALHELAALAGDREIDSRSPETDPHKERLRRKLAPAQREVFDLFAPPAGHFPDRSAALELADEMTRHALGAFPLLDPVDSLAPLTGPVRLMHGRGDVLIPFTQTPALARRLEPYAPDLRTGITGMFAHSQGERSGGPVRGTLEQLHFLRMLCRVFEVV